MSTKDVFILGGYQTDFARNWSKENKHISAMMREAFEGALNDVKIPASDIEAAIIGNFAGELYVHQGMLGAFIVDFASCLAGIPTMRTEAACASGALAVLTALSHVISGSCELVCVIGVEQMKEVDAVTGSRYLGTAGWFGLEAEGIDFPFPKLFARLADEYDKRFGIDTRHLAHISAKNYDNAKRNPNAQTRSWYMSYDHASTMSEHNKIMYGMLKVSDCSQISDGAVCIFLASRAYAENWAKKGGRKVEMLPRILGWGHTTAPLLFDQKLKDSINNPFILPHTRGAITQAFRSAGISDCRDLDCIETHDCFTSSEYMAIDHFGLTRPGESWKAIEEGVIDFNGQLPINPSGGLIGVGHPVGATGVRQALDGYKQVTGTAGEYQVEGARRMATLNIGGSATTNICLIIGK